MYDAADRARQVAPTVSGIGDQPGSHAVLPGEIIAAFLWAQLENAFDFRVDGGSQ